MRKENAVLQCKKYNVIDDTDYDAQYAQLKAMLGSVGEKVWIGKTFNCDNGKKIYKGEDALHTIWGKADRPTFRQFYAWHYEDDMPYRKAADDVKKTPRKQYADL